MVNAGATWVDAEVVRDGNWLTSRGPQDMVPFLKALLPFFAGQAPTAEQAAAPTVSSPQRNAPPQVVLTAMKWLPRPSLRTLAVVGAIAALYVARNHQQSVRRLAG